MLIPNGVLAADISIIFDEPLSVDSLDTAVGVDTTRLLRLSRIDSCAVDRVTVKC